MTDEQVKKAVENLIIKFESLEKSILSEQETFIKLINEVFRNE